MGDSKINTKLTFRQLFYLSISSFGLQVASTIELNNATGIFKFLGATDTQVSWLWLIPPLAGLIIQPLLGQTSDLVNTKYGKRIPFIFAGAVIASLALLVMTFSEVLWLTVLMILFLSCSINCSTEGLRSLVGDISPNEQKPTAFAWQAIFSGVGAMLASGIPYVLNSLNIFVKQSESSFKVPILLKVSFLFGAIVLVWSLLSMFREIKEKDFINRDSNTSLNKNNYISLFTSIWSKLFFNIWHMPKVIKKFFLIQILTWTGMFCVWLYFSLAIAQHIYHLPINANVTSNNKNSMLLTNGLVHTYICFAIYQLVSIIYVLILPYIIQKFNANKAHAIALFTGGISLFSIIFLDKIWLIYYAMIGVGIFWGSLTTLPYAIITAEVPAEKMGTCLGVFNITITLPQILCGIFIGFIYKYIFFNHAIIVILFASLCIFMAGIVLLKQEGVDLFYEVFKWFNKIFNKK
ncbi:MAG: major facilitator superfamily 1 [Burkholderiales bacterium]|jgi:maltose/moltooligosaccharide transporter|nr:major facilitator superfamily 1 [Burkholderiales bacterium]